jgi:hypothetical protein
VRRRARAGIFARQMHRFIWISHTPFNPPKPFWVRIVCVSPANNQAAGTVA